MMEARHGGPFHTPWSPSFRRTSRTVWGHKGHLVSFNPGPPGFESDPPTSTGQQPLQQQYGHVHLMLLPLQYEQRQKRNKL